MVASSLKIKGGYDVPLAGKPSREIRSVESAGEYYLPLTSATLDFSERVVREGEVVPAGQALARAPESYDIPLLAPVSGKVSFTALEGHVTLTPAEAETALVIEDKSPRALAIERGAWSFASRTDRPGVPNPAVDPEAILVSTMHFEPFLVRGDVLLEGHVDEFVGGLNAIRRCASGAPITVVIPDVDEPLADEICEAVEKLSGVALVTAPARYPAGNPLLQARQAAPDATVVWTWDASGVLAMHQAVNGRQPVTERVISVGGPGAQHPAHVRAAVGTPIESILRAGGARADGNRVVAGGALRGRDLGERRGLDVECRGLTVIPMPTVREFLAFANPGFNLHSYCLAFASMLRPYFRERYTTSPQGEPRPCLSCGFCEEICPAGIMPFLLHRYLAKDKLEEAQAAKAELCVRCGLCSYVCPSKIELSRTLEEGQERIRQELRGGGAA